LIAVAISVCVDSSTVAALLQEQGIPSLPTMQLLNQGRLPDCKVWTGRSNAACSLDDGPTPNTASRSHLNFFPHYVVT